MRTPEDLKTRKDRSRRGVALIIVLGFLTIMVLMALAFLTQARVERMVSSASLEGMRTRQMAQTAIAAAMQDYLNALKTVSPADSEHDIFLSGDGAVSLNNYYSGEFLGNDRLVIGKVEDWLSSAQLNMATNQDDVDDAQDAEWIWVREKPGQRSRILGRYAYACFDTSGRLDANLLGTDSTWSDVPKYGDATNRNNVRKMVYEALRQETGGDSQRKLNQYQSIWKGFDTPAALLNLTDGDWNDGRNSGVNRWVGADMDETPVGSVSAAYLSSYSYAVLHKEDGSGKEKIQCTASEIQNDSDFSKILGGGNKADVVKALADYEDSDSLPQGAPDYPSVEAVPMFNEIGVQTELVAGGPTGYQLVLRMRFEFWYPFPSDDNGSSPSFSMAAPQVGGDRNVGGTADIWVRLAGGTGTPTLLLATGPSTPSPSSLSVGARFNNNRPYYNPDGQIEFRMDLQSVTNPAAVLPPNMQLFVRNIQIKPLELRSGGAAVDKTPDRPIDIPLPGAAQAVGSPSAWYSVAVDDPRLNHQDSSWNREDPPTFGDINQATVDSLRGVDIPPGDYLYCRNGPMERPAELGYLSTGTAWETLDVFSEDGLRLMNRLVCDEDVFDILQANNAFFTNGTINPYTRHTNVLNAAFYGLDVREVPNMPGQPDDDERLNGSELTETVKAMMGEATKDGYAGWGKILASGNLPEELNKNMRIAMMNNTWGLFNESDRLFVVAVIAQSIKEGGAASGVGNWNPDEDVVTGERRAVALCWMDGSADVGGETLTQEMNIIMFQYLNE